MQFDLETLLITGAIFLFAAFFHGSIGFGFPMVATPLLALTTDLKTAVILTLIPTALINLISIASEGEMLSAVRKHLPLALFAMTGSAIGTQVLILSNSESFKALLALTIFGYLLVSKFHVRFAWVADKPGLAKPVFGISAGFLGGLTNVMAPVLIIYFLEAKLEKGEIVQSANTCFLLGKIVQLILFSCQGEFSSTQLILSTVMLLLVLVALFAGFKIKRRLRQETYTKALRIFLLLLAIGLLAQALN